jgi:site-specific recombinase XerC
MYSAGLRVGELVNLRVRDLEIDEGVGWVRKGKGNKDRLFIIAENLKKELSGWIIENQLEHHSYLFKGQNNYHISTRTVLKNS